MSIQKDIVDYNTGAIMSYHTISAVSTDKLNDVTVITVTSFAHSFAYNAVPRKISVATEQIVLKKVIPLNSDVWSWAYFQITDPQTVALNGITDKFVNGEIV